MVLYSYRKGPRTRRTKLSKIARQEPRTLAALAEQINEEHRLCEQAARNSVEHARAAGEMLIEAKSQVPHGGWLPWLEENFEDSERTAQVYMRIARDWPRLQEAGKTQRAADLSVRTAL